VLAVEVVDEGSVIRIDAVPRDATLPEQLPAGTVQLTPEQVTQLETFQSQGGDLQLDGVHVEFNNLPAAFRDLDPSGQEMSLSLRAPQRIPPPWNARFTMWAQGLDIEPVTIYLEAAADVPSDWDAAMIGKTGALRVAILLRKRNGRGQMTVQWSFDDDFDLPNRIRAAQLNLVRGLHRKGRLVIDDVAGIRPRLEFVTTDRDFDASVDSLRSFVADVATIEMWTGKEYRQPEHVPAREVRAIHDMARIIRTGESRMDFGRTVLTTPREKAEQLLQDDDHEFLVEIGIGLAVLGTEIQIGRLRGGVRDIEISVSESKEPGMVDVTLEPRSEAAAHPTFQLVR
jgi:hypothetical protein